MRVPKFVTAFPHAALRYGPKLLLGIGAIALVGVVVFNKMLPAAQGLSQAPAKPERPAAGGLGIEEARKRADMLAEQKETASMREAFPKLMKTVEDLQAKLTQKDAESRKDTAALQGQLTTMQQQLQAKKAAEAHTPAPTAVPPKQKERVAPAAAPSTFPSLGAKLYLFKPSEQPGKSARTPRSNHGQTAYIPWWSFAPVRIIFGGSVSSRERSAMPVLMVLTNEFTAPYQLQGPGRNPLRTAIEIQGCFAGGYAAGDLAASRVMIRAVALSCVFPSGESFEQPIEGFVDGGDGEHGIYAEVDHHASAAEAKAVLTGLLQEVSAALGLARSKVVVTSVAGGVQPFQGTQTMLQDLGRVYIQQMSLLLPTLRLRPNTPGSLVLQEGVTLEGLPTQTIVNTGGAAWSSY